LALSLSSKALKAAESGCERIDKHAARGPITGAVQRVLEDLRKITVEAQKMAMNSKAKKISILTAQGESQSAAVQQYKLFCGNCGRAQSVELKLKRCKQCHMFFYCSAECQKHHWPIHKPYCMQVRHQHVEMMGPDTSSVKGKCTYQLRST
jgi:hypothetical protein